MSHSLCIFDAWLMHLLMVQVELHDGPWLMHMFMVQVDYMLFCAGCYMLFDAS
jgi:hypothetical protein